MPLTFALINVAVWFYLFAQLLVVLSFQSCPSSSRRWFDSRNAIISHNEIVPCRAILMTLRATDNDTSEEDKAFYEEFQKRYEEIQIEEARCALEKQHTRSFLKSRPRKLPFKHARVWVQKNLGVDTKEEWVDFLEMGYIKSTYIPDNPEEYYTSTGEWISWDHFLNGSDDDDG